MRKLLVLALVLGLVGVAAAYDLGNQAPVKSPVSYPENIPNPVRQGGDTVANATVIPALPYNDSGTTVGYTDDYDESARTPAPRLPTSSTSTSSRPRQTPSTSTCAAPPTTPSCTSTTLA